jgi:hypothetical protein
MQVELSDAKVDAFELCNAKNNAISLQGTPKKHGVSWFHGLVA